MVAAGHERHGDVFERRLPWSDYKLEVCVGWIFPIPPNFIPLLSKRSRFVSFPPAKVAYADFSVRLI